jgi:hypothetical protein
MKMVKCVLVLRTRGMLGLEEPCERAHTFEYPHPEIAEVEFHALHETGQDFVFCGFPFRAADLKGQKPRVRSLEDWFSYCRIDGTSSFVLQEAFEKGKATFNRTWSRTKSKRVKKHEYFP